MSASDDLDRLRQHALALQKSIDDIDDELDRAVQAHEGSGQMLAYLRDCHEAQLGYVYDLGGVERQIKDLESLEIEEQERPQEQFASQQWQEEQPLAPEDHLDWFKQLPENQPQVETVDQAEQQMLQDMEREPSPDDHLDWFPRRS